MLDNKLLDIGHNGDPHMLWLFEDGNTNPNPPLWNYDSTRNRKYRLCTQSGLTVMTFHLSIFILLLLLMVPVIRGNPKR